VNIFLFFFIISLLFYFTSYYNKISDRAKGFAEQDVLKAKYFARQFYYV
jgi:hypothetical protein